MKQISLTAAAVLIMALALSASAVNDYNYNYAAGKAPSGTFVSGGSAVDGSNNTFAVSGPISESPQLMTIDLGSTIYVESVKIVWDARALSRNYSIRFGQGTKKWMTQWAALDASTAPASGNTVTQIINTRRYTIPTRYVQIYIPMASAASAAQVRIADIEVLPAKGLSFGLLEVTPFSMSGNNAIVQFKTTIGAASGQVTYGTDPADLSSVAAVEIDGAIGSARLTGLKAGVPYYYKVKAWDVEGTAVESTVGRLDPAVNVAVGKSVKGTFSQLPPTDKYVDAVSPVLNRVNDGKYSYFTGMGTSGPVNSADQYVTLDLGSARKLRSVVTYWRALAYPESFSVKISLDGKNWEEVGAFNAAEGAFARSETGDPMKVANSEVGKRARYVQVMVSKDSPIFTKHEIWNFVQLMEVEVII